jgi:hypothetical protein
VNDGAIMSETLATMSVALADPATPYRVWNEPTRRNVLLLGLVIGLAMLVAAELGLLLPVMVVAADVRVAGRERRERWCSARSRSWSRAWW